MIQTSLFELFKIGPGPSSSHTVGPMFAANAFRQEVEFFLDSNQVSSNNHIIVELYGSLADTGHGHGTHRAILAGLFNFLPTSVDVNILNSYFESKGTIYKIPFINRVIDFHEENIIFHYHTNPYRHPNTVKFSLYNNNVLAFHSIYYSIGGGFIEQEGKAKKSSEKNEPIYKYDSMAEFVALCDKHNKDAITILLENETAITNLQKDDIHAKLDVVLTCMSNCVENGLKAEGTLPGGLFVSRRAKEMYQKALDMSSIGNVVNSHFARQNAYALAVSEENAAGHIVVTAPTNGAAGIVPASLEYLKRDLNISLEDRRNALIIAGLIGFIIKHNASISGAELGCQAEVGSASAMAAAMFAYCFTKKLSTISSAAEIALEHSLGMTCDPINGLVQVPCIERNATGVIKAYNAYMLASSRDSQPLVTLDQVILVMKQTGLDLSDKYRETSTGGLAVYGWHNMPGS